MSWSHGHSLVTGGLLGLALVRADLFLVLAVVFVAGVAAGRLWARLGDLLRWVAQRGRPAPWPTVTVRSRRS